MIFEYFNPLPQIPGVEAFILSTYHRKEIDRMFRRDFNKPIIPDVVESVIQILGAQQKAGLDAHEIVIPYEKGVILIRAEEKFFVLVIGKHKMDVPLVRLFLDVTVPQLMADKKFLKMIKSAPGDKYAVINEFNLDEKETTFLEMLAAEQQEKDDGSEN